MADGLTIEMTALERLAESLQATPEWIEQQAVLAVNEVTAAHLARTKAATPVDTGELRRTWLPGVTTVQGGRVQNNISNNTEYSVWVEDGHRIVDKNHNTKGFVEGKKMMTKSFHIAEKELKSAAEDIAKKAGDMCAGGS